MKLVFFYLVDSVDYLRRTFFLYETFFFFLSLFGVYRLLLCSMFSGYSELGNHLIDAEYRSKCLLLLKLGD